MKDNLISRQAAIELCDWYEHEFPECDYIIRLITEDLKSLPPAEPERKQGEWLYPYESTKMICVCSICGHGSGTGLNPYNFCPHCGADMRGGKNHE